jgi:rod shape-determining protein MreD
MKGFYLVVTVFVFLLMQVVVADRVALGSVAPDFLVLMVAIFSLFRGAVRGSVFGFVVGFLQDLANPGYLGLNALTKSILGYGVGKVGAKTVPDNFPFVFVLFMGVSFGHDVIYLLVYHWPNVGSALTAIFVTALPSAAYTALFAVITNKVLAMAGPKAVESFGKEGH